MNKLELIRKVWDAIDARSAEIIDYGQDIFHHPELGYKETRTSLKTEEKFKALGVTYEKGIALTGLKARLKGRTEGPSICYMGELDSVLCPGHPHADPTTGAAHSCGHDAQMAAMIGATMGLVDAGAMQYLDGDVVPIAVPAEECVEIEFRETLKKQGKIEFYGGKQQFILEGALDDVDMVAVIHASEMDLFKHGMGTSGTRNGFLGKMVYYKGKEAHTGMAPHEGINALNAALMGIMGIHAQRETFKDDDTVRVHPIISKGGDLVNIVPADVRIELGVRARRMDAVIDASKKVDRALKAGAACIGAECEIINTPGYLPRLASVEFDELVMRCAESIVGKEKAYYDRAHRTSSNDSGDISHLMPAVALQVGGVKGRVHTEDWVVTDPELLYVGGAKLFATMAIELLWDGAKEARKIKSSYKAPYTKKQYIDLWRSLVGPQ